MRHIPDNEAKTFQRKVPSEGRLCFADPPTKKENDKRVKEMLDVDRLHFKCFAEFESETRCA